MILDKKALKFMAHQYEFSDFWRLNCDGKETAEQLQIIYDKSHVWFRRLISSALTDENKKKYALFLLNENLEILRTWFPNEYEELPLYTDSKKLPCYVKNMGEFLKGIEIESECYYIVFSIIYLNECILAKDRTMSLLNALEKSFKCSDLRDKMFEFGLELIKLQEVKNNT